ncbi:hypothetical protein RR48_10122 [Papilio machaon]|uniref:Uncharacterized protein n=1 Tax=Papilio machaon TaxID=76193 RepID=A0A194QZR2_PAPMA|nr:hypothetical protein RR48_10122 [Papilio machaon]
MVRKLEQVVMQRTCASDDITRIEKSLKYRETYLGPCYFAQSHWIGGWGGPPVVVGGFGWGGGFYRPPPPPFFGPPRPPFFGPPPPPPFPFYG